MHFHVIKTKVETCLQYTKETVRELAHRPVKAPESEEVSSVMGKWEEVVALDYDCAVHASLPYEDVADGGPPVRPLEFPTPSVNRCARASFLARDHRTNRIYKVNNVLTRVPSDRKKTTDDRAYLIKKRLSKSVYGVVRLCVVLRKQSREDHLSENVGPSNNANVEWESTNELVVVKASSWDKIRQLRGQHLEDPIKEVAALQHVGNYHPNVLGCLEVLQDDDYLYTIMPFCGGGELYGRMMGLSPKHTDSDRLFEQPRVRTDECQARSWFRQILLGLFHLQQKGVCHRDISLENLMVNENDQVVIIDFGMSLRVPYNDPFNEGCITDASAGTSRRLMTAQGQGGKLMYLAPEIVSREDAFDGFAADLWSAGVVLFVLLVGVAPFRWAHDSDKRFAKISKGGLEDLLHCLGIHHISPEACDLLQNILLRDPRKRLTLADVIKHPWVNLPTSLVQNITEPVRYKRVAPTGTQRLNRFRHVQKMRNGAGGLAGIAEI